MDSQVESSSLYALNGIIALGSSSDGQPLYETRNRLDLYYFVSDKIESSGGNGGSYYGTVNGLVNRRSHATNRGASIGNSVYPLVNIRVNDVAMTVLPNAPIDDITGLPVPTIAVATNGGVSVIKDDGSVVDWIETTGPNSVHKVNFRNDGKLGVYTSGTSGATAYPQLYYIDLPFSDVSSNYYYNFSALNFERYGGTAWEINATNNLVLKSPLGDPGDHDLTDMVDTPNLTYAATNGGLNAIIRPEGINHSTNRADMFTAAVAYIQKDYNTGYMVGNIKGAFLSDTDTTDAIEYVQNGYFNNDVSSWTIGTTGTTATLSSNRMLITAPSSGASWGYVYQGVTTEIGKTYKVSLKYDRGTVDGRINVRNDSTNTTSGALFYADLGTSNDGKTYFNTFTATATTTYILLYAKSTSGGTSAYDAVSVTLEKDHSVNNKGLNVFGTITKQPVATGADLVGYSGFSASNKLENRGDYNFGVGTSVSMCIIGWFKTTNISSYAYIMSVYDSGTDHVAGLAINGSASGGNNPPGTLYLYDSVTSQNSGTKLVNDGAWHCAVGVFDGPNRKIYLDGKLEVSNTFTSYNLDIADTDKLAVGRYAYNDSYHFLGSLDLTRITKSIPSAEQVKKIYDDEKQLFVENAKATLYGSSDVVTALGHDDSSNILHVGTSAGRSEFQGLRRINNTTTAVTTAISVSNGLVAEQ